MLQPKIPYLLPERGRFYYQRRVPLDFQDAVGTKKWRKPVGGEYLTAVDEVRKLTKEHDALLATLKNPEERRDHKAKTRRARETAKAAADIIADAAYRKWLAANNIEDP
ncbi:MAG: hypothetical protein OEX14_03610, partial [Paracoccaceae bacterium]|nr:hypothetical protein [Paracoccaceae bacterium]